MKLLRALFAGLAVFASTMAGAQQAHPDDVAAVQKAFKSDVPGLSPLYSMGEDGYLESLIAPPGARFEAGSPDKANDPAAAASAFVDQYRASFGVTTGRSAFVIDEVFNASTHTTVKMKQTYDGIPVYGAQVNVSVIDGQSIRGLVSDVMRNSLRLDRESDPTAPAKAPEDAAAAAKRVVGALHKSAEVAAEPSELVVYDPAILGEAGVPHLAYRTVVHGGSLTAPFGEEVLTDAHTNEVLLRYSLLCEAKARAIYDLSQKPFGLGQLVRSEGEPPAPANPDANAAYDFLGESYDFFLTNHGRDSYDGLGGAILASVHLPVANAFFTTHPVFGPYTAYGTGMAVDDIVAHEFTHAVTEFTSGLIYLNESGAINESMSDIWGEALDILNGSADDTAANRWLLGEGSAFDVIRSMKNPGDFDHPDRYGDYRNLPIFFDNGGVHINSGIGNKLFYLLVDGGEFNGYFVSPVNIFTVLDLYYRAQRDYLAPGSDYADLFASLMLAAADLGWTTPQIGNLVSAGAAVELVPSAPGLPLRAFRAQARPNSNSVVLTWLNPSSSAFSGVYLVRNLNRFPTNDADGVRIEPAPGATSYIDNALAPGQHAHYKLVAEFAGASPAFAPQSLFAHEESRAPAITDYMSEEFPDAPDLSFKQLLYAPVGDWTEVFGSNRPGDYANHRFYSLSIRHNVTALPVLRQNAVSIAMPDDRPLLLNESVLGSPIPFYGRQMSSMLLSPNGYIAPAEGGAATLLARFPQFNFPTYENHWILPKLSALFADLSPAAGGDVWTRRLNDRFVITFEKVPQYGVFPPLHSTFQMELFFSGHIRVTYLDVAARGAVVGLSDGRGVPRDPAVVPDAAAGILITDLSSASTTPAFNILPIAIQTVDEGDVVAFTVAVEGAAAAPAVTVENLPPGATFNPLTRAFFWETSKGDEGSYSVGFRAVSGGAVTFQNVFIIVRAVGDRPSIVSLAIAPEDPQAGGSLEVLYEYAEPNGIAEGGSDILWYRNGAYIGGLANQLGVPSEALLAGDQWAVAIIPRSAFGVTGDAMWSESVTIAPASKADINGDKAVDAVDIQLVINAILGKAVGALDADANLDGELNAADVQTVVNKALK